MRWFRLDLRRRWRSLLVMALLIALASGTVMTAVAGAKRGASAADRLLDQTRAAAVIVTPNEPGFDWDAVRELPDVETLGTFVLTSQYVIEETQEIGGWAFADDEMMSTLEVPVVLRGRRLDPERADEVVVSPKFEQTYGLGVGDTVTLRLFSPKAADELLFSDELPVEPDGPAVHARIVGVVRTPGAIDEPGDTGGNLIPSPGLYAEYGPNLVGASGSGIINAFVRLHGGDESLTSFKADLSELTGRPDIDMINMSHEAQKVKNATSFEANALWVFAAAAALAAVVLVGQSIARYSTSTVADLQVLRAVGLTPRATGMAAAAGPVLAAIVGSALGVTGAVAVSRWFPIGTAAFFEPAPGIDVDVPVLLVCAGVAVALVAAGAVGSAMLALRSAQATSSSYRSNVAAAAGRAGLAVPVVAGTRFALESGRGRYAVPVRPALAGSIVGVLGVLAAFTFSSGVDDAVDHPERFGQVHQLEAFVGIASGASAEDFIPVDAALPVIAADPDVLAVNDTRFAVAEIGQVPVTLVTLDPVDTPWAPTVTAGRLPQNPDEVALAPGSAKALGVAVGDVVTVAGSLTPRELTVTGLSFVPEGPHNDYVTGGWVTGEGYDSLFDTESEVSPAFKYHVVLVSLREGADPLTAAARIEDAATPVVAARVAEFGGDPAQVDLQGLLTPPWTAPSTVQEIQQIRALPLYLAGFLTLLAIGAVGHALATAVRRRRHDVAVLRALGMTRTQSRAVVGTQATVLALTGLVIGVPLGVALGRTVWRYVADTTPLVYVPPIALLALLLVIPIALVAANMLAAWPGHRAASLRVSHVLRTE
jgi:ABC-type lipoprotein release transport system permease subunit